MNILLAGAGPSSLIKHAARAPRAPCLRSLSPFFSLLLLLPFSGERERGQRAMCTALLAAFSLLSLLPSPTHAQTYPTRPVVIVVPFAAGGGNDVLARLLAQRMGASLGRQS